MSVIIPSYAYTYVKLGFLKQVIMDDSALKQLKDIFDIKQFIDFISPYYPGIKVKDYTIIEIEQALFHNLIKLIGKTLQYAPEQMREFLKAYLLKFEIENIKQIILATIMGLSIKEKSKRVNFLVEDYLDHRDFIEEFISLTTRDEIRLFLKNTKYNKAVREGLLYFRRTNEIFVLEAFLDKLFYDNLLLGQKRYDKKEKAMFLLFISHLVEIYNLKLIYRGIQNNISKQLLNQFIISNYLFMNQETINSLLQIDDINTFFKQVEDSLTKNRELKHLSVSVRINRQHFIWSLKGIYQEYYFKKFKYQIGDIDYSTIYRILELLIEKEKEIKFNIMPNVIRIIHSNYQELESKYGNI